MSQFGSNRSVSASIRSAVTDSNGNLIVSPDDGWTGSPLGVAARNQVTIGVPNGTFNLLPPDPVGEISQSNLLPYWDWAPEEGFTAAMSYDTTTQTNSVEIDPTAVGTALGTAILRTRIQITNDEGLDIRQYVSSSLVQVAKAAGTDKWTATLTSQYYDTTGAAIGTPYVIGTIGERGTATNLASYTNASGPISTSAAELELAYKVVVGTASPTYALQIKSVMVATEYGVIGGGGAGTGFIPLSVITAAGDLIKGAAAGSATVIPQGNKDQVLTVTGTALGSVGWQDLPANPTPSWTYQEFTTSGTFTVPSGVSHVSVWATGGGQGGQAGRVTSGSATTSSAIGGDGGRTSYWVLRRDIYVADVATVTIGIGAGGAGGTAITFSKAAGATTTKTTSAGEIPLASGGDTTFGTYFTVEGGKTSGLYSGFYGVEQIAGTAGGAGGLATGGAGTIGLAHPLDAYKYAPFVNSTHFSSAGSAGATATGSGGTGASAAGGAANAVSGFSGSGGGGGGGSAASSSIAGTGGAGGPGGGGSGGGAAARFISGASQTLVVTGGSASAGQWAGAGGGGGGVAVLAANGTANYASATITMTSGAGGAGNAGRLYVFWLVNV